ncbi:MAG TPA: MFS transporter, partial [Ktedonobacterales bacterium]
MSGPQATRDAVLRQAHAALAVARGFERNVWIILIFTLGKGLQLTIVNVTLSLYAHSLGFDNALIGALVAVPSIGALIASVPMGVLADRYGRKPMLIIGGLLNPLTLAALGLATSPTWLFIFGVLNGICANAYWVTFMPVLVESTTEEQRVAALAANNFLLLGVGALGALIGGAIPELVGHVTHLQPTSTIPLRWGLVTAALVTLLPTVPLFWLRERLIPRRLARAGGDATPAPQDPSLPMRDLIRLFTMLLVPDALFVLGESSAVALLALFFNVQFGLHPGALGVYLTVAGLIGGAMSFLAPRLSRRWGKLATATTSQIATVPAVLLIGFSPVFSL